MGYDWTCFEAFGAEKKRDRQLLEEAKRHTLQIAARQERLTTFAIDLGVVNSRNGGKIPS